MSQKVQQSRLRMARELHDTLGHHLSLISVQAATALHLVGTRPEQARLALAAIKDASRDALDGLRTALATLRGEQPAPAGPDPGLADLPRLIDRTGMAGLTVNSAWKDGRVPSLERSTSPPSASSRRR